MNNEEIRNEKIIKREKTDTALAYILIFVLLAAIGFITYLKFVKKDNDKNDTEPSEYTVNYISLDELSNLLNNSTLANRYKNDNISFTSSVVDNSLNIKYNKDDTALDLTSNMIGNELEIKVDKANEEVIGEIYKEILVIVCNYYNNDENACRSNVSLTSIDNPSNGIRYVKNDDDYNVYIDITNKANIEEKEVYNEEKQLALTDTNYKLNIEEVEIDNINLDTSGAGITVTGTITNKSENNNLSLIVKFYDENNSNIHEEKLEYNNDNILTGSVFEITALFDDTFKVDNTSTYSISVVRES